MSMDNLLKQAQEMKEKQQRELSATLAVGESEGGTVTATMDGHRHLRAIEIDALAIDPENLRSLERLVMNAINQATDEMDSILVSKFGPSSGIPEIL